MGDTLKTGNLTIQADKVTVVRNSDGKPKKKTEPQPFFGPGQRNLGRHVRSHFNDGVSAVKSRLIGPACAMCGKHMSSESGVEDQDRPRPSEENPDICIPCALAVEQLVKISDDDCAICGAPLATRESWGGITGKVVLRDPYNGDLCANCAENVDTLAELVDECIGCGMPGALDSRGLCPGCRGDLEHLNESKPGSWGLDEWLAIKGKEKCGSCGAWVPAESLERYGVHTVCPDCASDEGDQNPDEQPLEAEEQEGEDDNHGHCTECGDWEYLVNGLCVQCGSDGYQEPKPSRYECDEEEFARWYPDEYEYFNSGGHRHDMDLEAEEDREEDRV
jgi:hypothetical protein